VPASYRLRRRAALAVSTTTLGALLIGLAPGALATAPPYRSELLHFATHVGPNGATACDVIGELFVPAGADARHRVPSVLTTNGFGGSYTDQVGEAEALATDGYAVLTYSGLGFGGSACKIYLDDPLYDGEAGSQLVSFLGGAPGIGYTDSAHTKPAPLVDFVIHDRVDHAGHADRYDPRVGMVGGSYGGEIQFAVAGIDPRVDTIVPFITWNDLQYSLAPNDAGLTPGGPVTTSIPGATKSTWALGFSAEGMADGLSGASADPSRDVGCPNFANWVCPSLAQAGSQGYPAAYTAEYLHHASVADYMSRIRIPVLLVQGENDTLFNLEEASSTFDSLRARHVPVQMIWQSWGHSGSTPAPGELDLSNPNPRTQYEAARLFAWFDHYLKGAPVSTGPTFAYFRDWISYQGIATPAYATSPTFPVGRTTPFYLSAASSLVGRPQDIGVSTQRFVTPPAGAPTSSAPPDAVGGSEPVEDAPGTFASWTSAPLSSPLDVAGTPVLHISLTAPTLAASRLAGPAGDLVLFAKIYDVAPDGTAAPIHGLVAPARIASVAGPVQITLPAIVHRFAPGHRVELILAGGDINYRGGLVPTTVTVLTGEPGQVLDLPVVG
jgi:predicted acyl esterase